MKKTHFKIGLLTACLISLSSVASAQSCGVEGSGSGACKCSKKHCDDKGLLEVINSAASNFESRLASMIPDRGSPTSKPCSCDKCTAPSEFAMEYTEVGPAPTVTSQSVPHITPPVAQPDVVRPPVPRVITPPNPIVVPVPAPHSGRREAAPLPDSSVNPFSDEATPTTRNPRPVPARPASYLQLNNNVEAVYDPQANTGKSKRSVVNSIAAPKKMSDSSNGLAKTTSTRRTQPLPKAVSVASKQSLSDQTSPEVIPASSSVQVPSLRDQTPLPPAFDELVNPLRVK